MDINKHNYQEFLLLYIDGELQPSQMDLVDNFVASNPDAKVELELLLQTKLPVDNDVVFKAPETLLQYKDLTINLKNSQEQFLLYIDNELTPTQKAEVETFVLKHPDTQSDFTTLKHAKLPVETIVCPNKKELYKRDTKVVVFAFSRLAIAAVFIGLSITLWMLTGKEVKQPDNQQIVKQQPKTNEAVKEVQSLPGVNQPQMPVVNNNSTVASNTTARNVAPSTTLSNNSKAISAGLSNANISKASVATTTFTTSLQNASTNTATSNNSVTNNTTNSTVNSINNTTALTSSNNNTNNITVPVNSGAVQTSVAANNVTITPTVYKPLDVGAEEDDDAVLVGNMRLNKSKVSNFFKKAGKIFGKSKKASLEEDAKSATVSLK